MEHATSTHLHTGDDMKPCTQLAETCVDVPCVVCLWCLFKSATLQLGKLLYLAKCDAAGPLPFHFGTREHKQGVKCVATNAFVLF